ncbi:CocE/NonD family hydrolase [Chryseobacterium fluminis]|uniref:CocE/NonD family hydrolase n=1 Tax=Chryseobacterium fluminis TaxID=2983606 RepID=UPI0022584E2B|nr:CocE/NonD family hydrolase [Chryseobacterium sp. MMS21-Ot14]UZT96935.1 CocE/NonD family hydrolase [Chryseobacterium sp. MMS21-Ot14]
MRIKFKKNIIKVLLLILLLFSLKYYTQSLPFKTTGNIDDISFDSEIKKLNKEILKIYSNNDKITYDDNIFRLYILNEDYNNALYYLNELKGLSVYKDLDYREIIGLSFELYSLSKLDNGHKTYKEKYQSIFNQKINCISEKSNTYLDQFFISDESKLKEDILRFIKTNIVDDHISLSNAIKLCRYYTSYIIAKKTNHIVFPLLKEVEQSLYDIKDSMIIKTKTGNEISLFYVLNKKAKQPLPTILNFTIYNRNNNSMAIAKEHADKGYHIVQAYSRGVYLSEDELLPFEFEKDDVNKIIDWIVEQPWSNGKVGMIGGSYNGFSQWAATKNLNPALKTIIPSASVGFGIDFPMENNVFNTYMIRWAENVTKGRYKKHDDSDPDKWKNLVNNYYTKGIQFNKLDSLNGNTNSIFQKWLMHPSFDTFWQSKIPYNRDFRKINIPILTFTGYFDDDQRGAMYYYHNHHKFNKKADHYLVIGPYDHAGAIGNIKDELRGYKIDSVADIDMDKLSFEWFDYILKGKKKPVFLKNKVNYQVMGTNEWKNASDIAHISNKKLKLFLDGKKLQKSIPDINYISQKIDFSDRSDTLKSFDRYKIIDSIIDNRVLKDKLLFTSETFNNAFEMNGSFTGNVKLSINKKDLDINIKLYELTADGKYFLLSSYLGRASYAKKNSKRQLLIPDKIETIPVSDTYFVSKKIEKGSKLMVILGVNKSPIEQINYGTGKDVSLETIADAKEPLEIKWYNDSYIEIPVKE